MINLVAKVISQHVKNIFLVHINQFFSNGGMSMKKTAFLLILLISASSVSYAQIQCTDNFQCASGFYCAKAIGDCDGTGECKQRPEVCPDVYMPVCGCDWNEYGNTCEAAAAGVSMRINGPCTINPAMKVNVDIMPGYCPNRIRNLKSKIKVVQMAILGTADFDVSRIDPESVRVNRKSMTEKVAPVSWRYSDVATPFSGEPCDCHRLTADGYEDLILTFSVRDLRDTLQLDNVVGQTVPLIVGGYFKGGNFPVVGEDCIIVHGR